MRLIWSISGSSGQHDVFLSSWPLWPIWGHGRVLQPVPAYGWRQGTTLEQSPAFGDLLACSEVPWQCSEGVLARPDIYGHDLLWETGVELPEEHHWPLAGPHAVCLQGKSSCISWDTCKYPVLGIQLAVQHHCLWKPSPASASTLTLTPLQNYNLLHLHLFLFHKRFSRLLETLNFESRRITNIYIQKKEKDHLFWTSFTIFCSLTLHFRKT